MTLIEQKARSHANEDTLRVADEIGGTAEPLMRQQSSESEWLTKLGGTVQETPFMLTDLDFIRNQCLEFKRVFSGVELFYAMKAFPDDEVLLAVEPLVDGFDAASLAEIDKLLSLGINPSRIAFSNPVKPESHIKAAAVKGIDKFAFQTADELEKIARSAPGGQVYVRVKMDDAHSVVRLSVKYGCAPEAAIPLLQQAQKSGLKPLGINFHIGSQQTSFETWLKAIHKSKALIEEARKVGLDITMVNVGGGFPAQYLPDDPTLEEVAQAIKPAMDEGAKDDIRYMAEPGRFIVAGSSAIVGSVIGKEDRDGKCWVYLDVGLFNAFLGAQRFDPFIYPPVSLRHFLASDKGNDGMQSCVITGPSCDSHDIICEEAQLPHDLCIGDRLVFRNTGAYTIVYASSFNGFAPPKRYFIGGEGRV